MEVQTRSADQMVKMVMEDPKRLESLKANPLPELEKLRAESMKALRVSDSSLKSRCCVYFSRNLQSYGKIGSAYLTTSFSVTCQGDQ